jgi:hypothetical protein
MMREGVLTLTLLLVGSAQASAEWQIRPFLGVTFGGASSFGIAGDAVGSLNVVFGANGGVHGNVFGLEADFSRVPGVFHAGEEGLILGSSATTLTGNLVVSMPRRLTEFTLGPYFVVGAGMMHVNFDLDAVLGVLPVASTLATMDVGGGVTGNLSERLGLNWDARYFRTLGGDERGFSIGEEQLSFWRAIMAVVIRY